MDLLNRNYKNKKGWEKTKIDSKEMFSIVIRKREKIDCYNLVKELMVMVTQERLYLTLLHICFQGRCIASILSFLVHWVGCLKQISHK